MRSLITAIVRRCDRGRDRGAVLVWVGSGLVALVGMGALVIDVGALYAERRVLQNGADAAALAVAKDCAAGNCDEPDEYITADAFADDNAGDGASRVPLVCGNGPGLDGCPPDQVPNTDGVDGWVKVDTATHTDDGGTVIPFVLAPVLNAANVGQEVHASAVAAWGPAGSTSTIPLIFSVCEFNELGGSLSDGAPLPTGTQYVYFKGDTNAPECPAGPSGGDLPGGFGWLDETDCEANIEDDETVLVDTGNDIPQDCRDELDDWVGQEFLIPLFDDTNDLPGSNTDYHIAGFAGFLLTGYVLQGNNYAPDDFGSCPLGNPSTICLRGEFTEVVGTGGFGGGEDFGARVVKMIG